MSHDLGTPYCVLDQNQKVNCWYNSASGPFYDRRYPSAEGIWRSGIRVSWSYTNGETRYLRRLYVLPIYTSESLDLWQRFVGKKLFSRQWLIHGSNSCRGTLSHQDQVQLLWQEWWWISAYLLPSVYRFSSLRPRSWRVKTLSEKFKRVWYLHTKSILWYGHGCNL